MSVFVVRLEFTNIETAEYVQKRIRQELGLNAAIGEEVTPFEDQGLMDHNERNETIVRKLADQ